MDHTPGVEYEPALTEDSQDQSSYWEATGEEPALRWTDRSDLPTFKTAYQGLRATTQPSRRWLAIGLAMIVAGPFAILGAFLGSGAGISLVALLLVVSVGPLVEEMLKASGALYLAEQRPWLVPAGWTLPVVTLSAGVVFAVIENLVYLNIYIPDPTQEIIRWRWIAGPILHGGASLVAGLGIRRMWKITHTNLTPPRLRHAAPYLIAAVVVHGLYNLTVTLAELTGGIF